MIAPGYIYRLGRCECMSNPAQSSSYYIDLVRRLIEALALKAYGTEPSPYLASVIDEARLLQSNAVRPHRCHCADLMTIRGSLRN
jgi:hypothetical protein